MSETFVCISKAPMESKQRTGSDHDPSPHQLTNHRLFFDIDQLMIHSLKAVQGVINNDRYSFLL
jgi:hypothetical protein